MCKSGKCSNKPCPANRYWAEIRRKFEKEYLDNLINGLPKSIAKEEVKRVKGVFKALIKTDPVYVFHYDYEYWIDYIVRVLSLKE